MIVRKILAGFPILLLSVSAQAADPEAGLKIARRWCAACHIVAPDQTLGSPDVPSFAAIAARFTTDKDLTNFLAAPYPRMPNMMLSRPEISDLVSYIRSLDPQHNQVIPLEKDIKPDDPHRG